MLTLPIKKKWYDMIISGEKKEEYRDIKPYYTKRFQTKGLLDRYGLPVTTIQKLILKNGYGKDAPQALVDVTLDIRQGKPEWGAEVGKEYYVLKIVGIPIHSQMGGDGE